MNIQPKPLASRKSRNRARGLYNQLGHVRADVERACAELDEIDRKLQAGEVGTVIEDLRWVRRQLGSAKVGAHSVEIGLAEIEELDLAGAGEVA